ncbi:phosphatase inhibitor-domain-containing protein [Amylocarpus encephaloides]|uniref:Type 1 phosphatases regulator n=1 Tax=Amylocarpus encephaloides TaxID=45428 RepID=A0A9P7YNF6_9HELO|nr:phosphatase inhibitor-domain-containing protein [Amylocarpus encephaloides]
MSSSTSRRAPTQQSSSTFTSHAQNTTQPTSSQTQTQSLNTPSATIQPVLHLRGVHSEGRNRPKIKWAEDVVDNEGLGRKKSKVCCIYHKPRGVGESDSESSDSSDDSGEDGEGGEGGNGDGGKGCGHGTGVRMPMRRCRGLGGGRGGVVVGEEGR